MGHEFDHEWLPGYLRDHYAGATAGVRLFGRVADTHSWPHVRAEVAGIHAEIKQERADLQKILQQLEIRSASATMVAAVVGEKLGRFKPNGNLAKRSTAADVLELETLSAAVQAKSLLWETLLALAETYPELHTEALLKLRDQAIAQRETLMALHKLVVTDL